MTPRGRKIFRLLPVASVLAVVMLSCTSEKQTAPAAASPTAVRTPLPKDEQGNDLPIPETVRAERVQNDSLGVKTITMGNANGSYVLSCNTKADGCITPMPGTDYYVFKKNTKWKFPGATGYITLAWIQDWTVTYTHGENIALVPAGGAEPGEVGMYWLSSWAAPDKQKQ